MSADKLTLTGIVPASGTVRLTLRTTQRRTYVVSQVSVSAPLVGGGATCAVYLNGAFITPVEPHGDAAAGEPPVTVRPGESLYAEWASSTPGARVEATFIYDDGM